MGAATPIPTPATPSGADAGDTALNGGSAANGAPTSAAAVVSEAMGSATPIPTSSDGGAQGNPALDSSGAANGAATVPLEAMGSAIPIVVPTGTVTVTLPASMSPGAPSVAPTSLAPSNGVFTVWVTLTVTVSPTAADEPVHGGESTVFPSIPAPSPPLSSSAGLLSSSSVSASVTMSGNGTVGQGMGVNGTMGVGPASINTGAAGSSLSSGTGVAAPSGFMNAEGALGRILAVGSGVGNETVANRTGADGVGRRGT
ncbi:hypothetical protein MMC19_002711 [Ptychographa xylographoides]|nr:hypothetical protein [Ptychographa xylographoides]